MCVRSHENSSCDRGSFSQADCEQMTSKEGRDSGGVRVKQYSRYRMKRTE